MLEPWDFRSFIFFCINRSINRAGPNGNGNRQVLG